MNSQIGSNFDQALCTEAALSALRRRYPQIYESNDKLLIDVNSIEVMKKDFIKAMKSITPTAHRLQIYSISI